MTAKATTTGRNSNKGPGKSTYTFSVTFRFLLRPFRVVPAGGRGWVRPYLTLYVNAIVSAGYDEIDKIGINLINTPALTYNVT